ncbi:MAG: crotonase/enoyl-CoA hydratase family protein [Bacteroidetes bacterium]|nr:MAG: crotonase/enoyl-CoA hydratase family protein [Bacteroidota bacterium]
MENTRFLVKTEQHIAHVSINRADKANAFDLQTWADMKQIFQDLDNNPEVRVIVLSAEGKHFCSGIDLTVLMSLQQQLTSTCNGRKAEQLRKFILDLQATVNAIEDCKKPVLAAIHGGCIGGGVDIILACDMRYCSEDAFFCVKEIEMGMVADLGTLQRLPKIIASGIAREMAFTGRNVGGKEAEKIGLVNNCYADKELMLENVKKIAESIASYSPLSVRGTKEMLNYTRDHSVADGLNYIATWNAGMLISADLTEAMQAKMQKRSTKFE